MRKDGGPPSAEVASRTLGGTRDATMTDTDPDVRWLSYAEAAAALGVNPESVAKRMRRNGWRRRPGNDGKPRIGVPVSALPVPPTVPPSVPVTVPPTIPDNAAESTASVPDINPPVNAVPDLSGLALALAAHAQEAAARADRAEAALAAAESRERDALARVAEARLVDAAELGALRAEVARLAADLEEARAPWWRRWFTRGA